MKNLVLLFLTLAVCSTGSFAQNSIQLNIHHKLGETDFAMDTPASTNLGLNFKVSRLQYYISEISIFHDGGMQTNIDDVWILVDAAEATQVDLGTYNIDAVEQVRFHIGVDQDHNHLDPASYASDHPLAPKFPSMHWGWAPGYRFVALEGKGGANLNQAVELHGLGDANYFKKDLVLSATAENNVLVINLDADYTRALEDINVNAGVIVHGETAEAKKTLENFRDFVFSPSAMTTSTVDFSEIKAFELYPNPAIGGETTFRISSTENYSYAVVVSDLLGRTIQQISEVPSNTTIDLQLADAGLYFISLVKDGQTVLTQKLVSNY